jgi:hypothetical protein
LRRAQQIFHVRAGTINENQYIDGALYARAVIKISLHKNKQLLLATDGKAALHGGGVSAPR